MTLKMILMTAAFTAISLSCSDNKDQDITLKDPFVSDIAGVAPKHITSEHWTGEHGGQNIIMTASEIKAFNAASIAGDLVLYDIAALPRTYTQAELLALVRSISNIPKYERIYSGGTPVNNEDFALYEAGLNLDAIKETNPVRYALAVTRTSIRTYPTDDLLFSKDASDRDIERFQESTLFPGDAVAVLHISADGKWALIQSYNYIAWTPLTSLAIGTHDAVIGYANSDNFLVITGDKVSTVYNDMDPRVSELSLDMGVKIPLSRPESLQHNLYGQNPYLSHMVLLPVRMENGDLKFKHALISRNQDVSVGYLPFTRDNIIKQSFKFLGERYGWGHRFNGRDCTGFVSEIYKSFGILLPRNSGDQGRSKIGVTARYDDEALRAIKIGRIKNGKPGDLIYIPGHVMMLLGHSGGQPFVIHDVHGYGHMQDDGSLYRSTLNGVSVTPLLSLQSNLEQTWLDRAYAIKTIK